MTGKVLHLLGPGIKKQRMLISWPLFISCFILEHQNFLLHTWTPKSPPQKKRKTKTKKENPNNPAPKRHHLTNTSASQSQVFHRISFAKRDGHLLSARSCNLEIMLSVIDGITWYVLQTSTLPTSSPCLKADFYILLHYAPTVQVNCWRISSNVHTTFLGRHAKIHSHLVALSHTVTHTHTAPKG